MTRNFALTVALVSFAILLWIASHSEEKNHSMKIVPQTPPTLRQQDQTLRSPGSVSQRQLINASLRISKTAVTKIRPVNKILPNWQEDLEKTLSVQGGDTLKDISIEKVESLIWMKDGMAFNVESVIVSLVDKNNVETSFRALVDSQTGKIVKSWDAPVMDPVNPRQSFGIRLDPRYHQD